MDEIIKNFKEIVTNKYAQFNGRAGRKEYWLFVLVMVVISAVLSLLTSIFGGIKFLSLLLKILSAIVSLALLLPSLAVSVRRLHDVGKGGGWIFINLVPLIGWIWFLVLMIKAGELETNRFGEPVE